MATYTGAPPGSMMTAWNNLGLPGEPTSVDDSEPLYGGAHQLVTSVAEADPHVSVGTDVQFAPVWCSMIGP
jgi:hypothetical protein